MRTVAIIDTLKGEVEWRSVPAAAFPFALDHSREDIVDFENEQWELLDTFPGQVQAWNNIVKPNHSECDHALPLALQTELWSLEMLLACPKDDAAVTALLAPMLVTEQVNPALPPNSPYTIVKKKGRTPKARNPTKKKAKRRRGRPRKRPLDEEDEEEFDMDDDEDDDEDETADEQSMTLGEEEEDETMFSSEEGSTAAGGDEETKSAVFSEDGQGEDEETAYHSDHACFTVHHNHVNDDDDDDESSYHEEEEEENEMDVDMVSPQPRKKRQSRKKG